MQLSRWDVPQHATPWFQQMAKFLNSLDRKLKDAVCAKQNDKDRGI